MAEKFTEETIKNLKKLNDYEIIIGGKKQRPIVIMPPDGSNQEHFRVYAYGGQIGRVPFDIKKWYHLASDKKYSEYLEDGGNGVNKQLRAVTSITQSAKEETNKYFQDMLEGIFG